MQFLFSFDLGMRDEKTLIQTLACQLSSTLMQLLFSFDEDTRVEKIFIQTLACQLSSTLMQLLFSFDQDTRVEKTFIQTLACQLSSTLVQLLFSIDQDMRKLNGVRDAWHGQDLPRAKTLPVIYVGSWPVLDQKTCHIVLQRWWVKYAICLLPMRPPCW